MNFETNPMKDIKISKIDIDKSKLNLEEIESGEKKIFERRKGYILEEFSCKINLYNRMEELRKDNPTEVSGYVIEKEGVFGFYYNIGDNENSSELSEGVDNSWHSHPDNVSENVFDDNNLSEGISQKTRELAKNVVKLYSNIDEASPEKISLMDIINISTHYRKKDLISLPSGLLEINSQESDLESLFSGYKQKLESKWKELGEDATLQITESNFEELRINMVLEYYQYAIDEFKKIIEELGYEKMDKENFLEILEKIGLKHSFHSR